MEQLYTEPIISGLFLIFGCLLLFLEVFIPSGGILGILAIAAAGFGIFGLFHQERGFLAFFCIALFLAYSIGMLLFIMKRLSFKGKLELETNISVDERIAPELIGTRGEALMQLRPAGMALIGGKRIDVVSAGSFIEKGATIQVIELSGNRVVVREVQSGDSVS